MDCHVAALLAMTGGGVDCHVASLLAMTGVGVDCHVAALLAMTGGGVDCHVASLLAMTRIRTLRATYRHCEPEAKQSSFRLAVPGIWIATSLRSSQ